MIQQGIFLIYPISLFHSGSDHIISQKNISKLFPKKDQLITDESYFRLIWLFRLHIAS